MDGKVPIVNYQQTNTLRLLQLTEKLKNAQFFESYLTSQQRIVLDTLLAIPDPDTKFKVWHELMQGNATLDVEKVEVIEEQFLRQADNQNGTDPHDIGDVIEKPDSSNIENEANVASSGPDNQEEEDFSELDLENFKQQIIGVEFIGNLSLKIRYVLWQCAIDSLYTNEGDEFNQEGKEIFDYILLDDHTSQEKEKHSTEGQAPTLTENREEDEDYDDEDEDFGGDDKSKVPGPQSRHSVEVRTKENGRVELVLKISKDVLSKLRTDNVEQIMQNCSKIYHNFEHDKETMLKRLKLDETEMLDPSKKRSHSDMDGVAGEENGNQQQDGTLHEDTMSSTEETISDGKRPRHDSMNIPVNLGAANLSLKHLLSSIQENKHKLRITDYELKHLIMDVRKNRSKWASDARIGQEELYEACEKVVLELRNYTEHSTPFLNKVSKREAPNYHQIIKKSMDLNTVLKKLKTFQYNSKQEFVEDIMLIWKNCLTYNSDPSHFLRGHAIAMQKKSMQLIPLIPNIVVRNRADVEKEFEEMERDKDYEEDEEVAGSGRKGLNMGAHKPAKNHDAQEASKGGGKHPVESSVNSTQGAAQKELSKQEQLTPATDAKLNESEEASKAATPAETDGAKSSKSLANGLPQNDVINSISPDKKNGGNEDEEEDEEEEEEEEEMADSQAYLVEKDDDRDDVEISVWKSLTAKVRAEICFRRSQYFKDGRLNKESRALLKDPQKMKSFEQLYDEYKEQKALELQTKQMEQESIMKNGFRTAIKQEDEDQLPYQESALDDSEPMDKESNDIELDNGMFLQEYDSSNVLPGLAYYGIDSTFLDKEEDAWTKRMLEDKDPKPSIFMSNRNKGLTPKVNKNIELIQQIRHLCHKISLIRLLQNPTYSQSSKFTGNPNQFVNTHQYKYHIIDDSIDLDPVSQLPTHDYKANKELMWKLMYRNVGKIAMSNGFETTQPSAISMLTEISGDYLSNLIKSVKLHQESNSLNHTAAKEILHMSLLENGINKPDDLYTYIEAEFTKKTKKLTDVKGKLENFLRDLLRPTLQELSERNFDDESQSFVTGDFASEITGEDFFGFRELGLEREFGVLSSAVPLHLLSFQFQATDSEDKVQIKKIQPEEFDSVGYKKLKKQDIDEESCVGIIRPLLKLSLERSTAYRSKNAKSNNVSDQIAPNVTSEDDKNLLLEDDEMVLKAKTGSKPRVPPTGKISISNKKKAVGDMFVLPETDDKEEKSTPAAGATSSVNTPQNVPASEIDTSSNTTLNLSIPRLDQ
ncbi:related to Transcriptional activator SPT7 [Zygosaccharomyces bailii]|nr:related to Transcriptional activator SPT7 [Zygosaccharomyces bailii]